MPSQFAVTLISIAAGFVMQSAAEAQTAGTPPAKELRAVHSAEIAGQGPAQGRSADIEGNWIVRGYPSGLRMALVKIAKNGRAFEASLLRVAEASPVILAKSSVDDLRVDESSVRFKIRLAYTQPRTGFLLVVDAYLPPNDLKPAVLNGSMNLDRNQLRWPARLERTSLTELDRKAAAERGPGLDELRQHNEAKDSATKLEILRDALKRFPREPIACTNSWSLFYELVETKASLDEVRAAAADSVHRCAPYGPELVNSAVHSVAWSLVNSSDFADLGLEYARRAERALQDSDPPSLRAAVLKTFAAALRKAGKATEADSLAEGIAKLDPVLDQDFAKKMPAVKPKPFAVRRGGGNRAVLIELFTGAQCRPCVVADLASDALLQTFRPDDLVVVEYHMNIPSFDPLCNNDAETRSRYYGAAYTPFICVDGKDMGLIGLAMRNRALLNNPEAGYDLARPWVEQRLEVGPEARLTLSAERTADKIQIRAEVSDFKRAGEKIRLRFVLLDETVSYRGSNGVRLHRNVPRAFPGGVDGLALTEASCTKVIGIHLGIVRKDLERYLDRFNRERGFPDNDRPVGFGRLKVVGFIQDDATKEVLQARQIDVPEGREP
jgi:hypothetical protein